MSIRTSAVTLALVCSLALVACGSDDEGSAGQSSTASNQAGESSGSSEGGEAEAESATPEEARKEIGEGRAALDSALTALKSGDAKAAENAVSEGYLQHFEKVEGPLEKVDAELNEELEETIREDLRDKIRNGGSLAEVTAMISDIKTDLDTAEQKLS